MRPIRRRAGEMMQKAITLAIDIGIRIIQLAGYYVYYEPHMAASRDRYGPVSRRRWIMPARPA